MLGCLCVLLASKDGSFYSCCTTKVVIRHVTARASVCLSVCLTKKTVEDEGKVKIMLKIFPAKKASVLYPSRTYVVVGGTTKVGVREY